MRIASVPPSLQLPSLHPSPRHAPAGVSIEHHFGQYAAEHALDTDWIYLPIYWTANYVTMGFRATETTQRVIDGLSPTERYFTIVQADDGVYEKLPNNVLVFGAGGTGDVPIPLLCDPHTTPPSRHRDYLASFIGHIECGGPASENLPHSSWNADGAGAIVRRAMVSAFCGAENCHVEDRQGEGFVDIKVFRNVAARSQFSLAPRGYGKTSFRLYEAMGLGSIPVYIFDNIPWLPYVDVVDWSGFCVFCPSNEIDTLPERLLHTTAAWQDNARAEIARLLPECFTKDGMCRQIFRMIEERT